MTNLSTYLQAVEDCKQIIAKSRTVEEKYGIGKTEMMAREQAINAGLQQAADHLRAQKIDLQDNK